MKNLICILLLLPLFANAQFSVDSTGNLKGNSALFYRGGVGAVKYMWIPADTLTVSGMPKIGQIAVKNGIFYVNTGSGFVQVTGGGSSADSAIFSTVYGNDTGNQRITNALIDSCNAIAPQARNSVQIGSAANGRGIQGTYPNPYLDTTKGYTWLAQQIVKSLKTGGVTAGRSPGFFQVEIDTDANGNGEILVRTCAGCSPSNSPFAKIIKTGSDYQIQLLAPGSTNSITLDANATNASVSVTDGTLNGLYYKDHIGYVGGSGNSLFLYSPGYIGANVADTFSKSGGTTVQDIDSIGNGRGLYATQYYVATHGGIGTVTNVGSGFGTNFAAITNTGNVIVDSATIATRLRVQKGIDSITANFYPNSNPNNYISSAVTSVATNNGTGITGGTITSTGTIAADTTILATRPRVQKAVDSLNVVIGTKGTGSVSSVSAGTGMNFSPITTTGNVSADTTILSTRLWRQKLADSLNPIIAGKGSGSVTNITSADGSVSIINPTTTPDISVVKSPKLTTARTIGGVSFDGTANITVSSATGGFSVSGGGLALPSLNAIPSAPGTGNVIYTTSVNQLACINNNGFYTVLDFTGNTANRKYTGANHDFTLDNLSTSTTTTNGYFKGVGGLGTFVTSIGDGDISSSGNWNTAYTNRVTSLTTTGSSGAATLSSNTLNIPNYTASGLGAVTTSTSVNTTAPITGGGDLSTSRTIAFQNIAANSVPANTTAGSATPSGSVGYGTTYTQGTASLAEYDTHGNITINNPIEGYVPIVSSTATPSYTYTVDSARTHVFTGSITTSVNLPAVSTCPLGTIFHFIAPSANMQLSLYTSGGNLLSSLPTSAPGEAWAITAATSGTGVAAWNIITAPVLLGGSIFTVPMGGTGRTNLTSNAILIGNGTSAIGLLSTPSTGEQLVSNTSAAPSWSFNPPTPISTITDAATLAIDLSLAEHYKVQLGGNRTLGVPTNLSEGLTYYIDFWQDATGSRTLTSNVWPYTASAATFPTLSTSKGDYDKLKFVVDNYKTATVTMTIATPCVVTWTASGLYYGQQIQFTTTGALPTGVSANTTYYVNPTAANTFNLATSLTNLRSSTFVATSGSQSGTHTATACNISITTQGTDLNH